MKHKKKNFPTLKNDWLYSENQVFLKNIYQRFLRNPKKIDSIWYKIFKNIDNKKDLITYDNKDIGNSIINKKKKNDQNLKKNIFNNNTISIRERFLNLIRSFRKLGHYSAHLDPLNLAIKKNIMELSLDYYNFSKNELKELVNKDLFPYKIHLKSYYDIYILLKKTYCSSIGFEFMHLNKINEKIWLQKYIEKKIFSLYGIRKNKKNIIKGLIQSETFESFIHTKFPGTKRFSLEGCDVLIPMLKEIIQYGILNKTKKIFFGMAHRGRLNVMFNIFKCNIPQMYQNYFSNNDQSHYTGDVKYHLGAKITIKKNFHKIDIVLLDNPSHLEIITPIVLGQCKSFLDSTKTESDLSNNIIPIIIHGDAAFTGQGVIQETLNMSQVPGYCVFGSIHIIINNQIGFTTSKKKYLQSSTYCTDIAKMIDSPIFHVNADQPESVIFIIKLALKFRFLFKKDVFIDLVCYRRLGHNEADDPSITQPLLYKTIKNHKKVCDIYLNKINKFNNKYTKKTQKYYELYKIYLHHNLKNNINKKQIVNLYNNKIKKNQIIIDKIKNFSFSNLIKKMLHILTPPKNFLLHYQVKKIFDNRLKMIEGNSLWDWGSAEILSYAALIIKGITCRLSGEDVRRGTFSHRHAAVYCQNTGKTYIPLKNIFSTQNNFHIWDSVLSEEATLAFEYGYSISKNFSLNIWEAQFGDFVNGGQVIIDQFIVSGQQKWGHNSSIVLMLPHGYEGQGPEHSSARIERFLQLCAQKNMRVCIPTTPAQLYHLIQKQGTTILIKKPLIIFTPKSLLRNSKTFSTLKELSHGTFQKVLIQKKNISCNTIKKIIFCSGKIYYDLLKYYQKNNLSNILIMRLEQLYPFPTKSIKKVIHQFCFIENCIWCQEEPKNQGAWVFFYFNFKKYISNFFKNVQLQYIGRPKWASTAEGNLSSHKIEQHNIIKKACTPC
ncbi:2-oxoglutarate dehydrogenase E1 component [Buchnera aphidicola (Cinara tujafilina)]|uniref:oxoglutarate dehydrogenase (succinyl-transferring) n=1 Tax=Buchnera aphidicola (Cinara tujafilina) TaxID=261317 RepID=F7WZB8_9GAMM|nr:2-oxoglutarate dehydrogenase E1 component [Buchnera aphidicola]AEH39779.1 2-oxoglutarate dehydrogenase E1 component [Buchnera aphidicola (Cinara tujafilina)]